MIQPEFLFTMPGLYEALPAYRDELFLDEQGKMLPVDLFNASFWPRYGWSIYGAAPRKRVEKLGEDDPVLGGEDDRTAWLEQRLDRARRVHTVLQGDVPGFARIRYYQVQGTLEPTVSRAVLIKDSRGEWETLTIRDKRVRRNDFLNSLSSEPGDRHVTRESQDWFSPQERALIEDADYSIDSVHRMLFNELSARQRILEFLLD